MIHPSKENMLDLAGPEAAVEPFRYGPNLAVSGGGFTTNGSDSGFQMVDYHTPYSDYATSTQPDTSTTPDSKYA